MTDVLVENPPAPLDVPVHFRKGARPNWHQARRRRSVLSLLQGLHGRVLDYGCGFGDLTHAVSHTHPVEGVDVDPGRVAFAASEYAPIPFQVCAAAGLPFAAETFDIVASVVVIHFVPDPLHYLREIHRALRAGGHLLIACKNESVVRNCCRRLLGKGPSPSRLWVRPRAEVEQLLERAGFQIEADTYFYDPPFDSVRNASDVCVGAVEQVLSLLQVKATCGYYVLRARKV